jgi:hypothetical membrane protein
MTRKDVRRRPALKVWKYSLSSVSGLLVILLYCAFTLTSWALYPLEYSPFSHFLSRLGDYGYSPIGAYFYNAGCILTGIALVPFFIGLLSIHGPNLIQRGVAVAGQVLGVFSGIALMLIGIYSEDQGTPHLVASSIFFELNFIVLLTISLSLLVHGRQGVLVSIYGFAIAFSSLVFVISFESPLVEWYTVFSSLGYVGLIAWLSQRLIFPPQSESMETVL